MPDGPGKNQILGFLKNSLGSSLFSHSALFPAMASFVAIHRAGNSMLAVTLSKNHQRPPFNHHLPVDNRPPMDYGRPPVNGPPPPAAPGVAPPPGPIDLMALCREGKVKEAVEFLNQGICPDPPTFFALVASCSDPKFLLPPPPGPSRLHQTPTPPPPPHSVPAPNATPPAPRESSVELLSSDGGRRVMEEPWGILEFYSSIGGMV